MNSNLKSKHMNHFIKGLSTYRKAFIILLVFCIVFNTSGPVKVGKAATGSQVMVQVNYIDETAIVTSVTGGSIKFYMSTDNKKTWDMLEPSGVVDISSLLSTKEVVLYFKGNKDTEPAEVRLQAEPNTLQVSYKITNGDGRIEFNSTTQPVEYRKGANGQWKTATNLMSTAIYEIKGTTLYFRTPAAVDKRAGKIITVKIAKKPTGPSVKLDFGKLSITGLKSGETQYRVGDSTTWSTFTSTNSRINYLDLRSLLAPTSLVNSPIPAGTIEFRTAGNDKKSNSAIKVVEVPLQPTAPDSISINGTTITVTDSNTKRFYEYTVVPQSSTLDLSSAKWTSFTSKSPVIVSKANINDKILVRLKSATDTTSKQTSLASTYKEFTVTSISIRH